MDKYLKHPSISSCVWPTTRNPSLTSSNISFTINNDINVNKYLFLLSFTQLSIWSKKIIGNGLGPTFSFGVFNSLVLQDLLCKKCAKNAFWRRCSNNILDSQAGAFCKVQRSRNNDPIVKLGSLGHNSLEYCAYFSSQWSCAINPSM